MVKPNFNSPDTPKADYERFLEALGSLKGRYRLKGTESDAFNGWVRPRKVYGLEAVDLSWEAKSVERTYRDVRLDGTDHYYAVFQISGRSAMTQKDCVTELNPGDVTIVDSAQPVSYVTENNRGQWLSLILPRNALKVHLGSEPKGRLCGRGNTRAGHLLFQLVRESSEDHTVSTPADLCMQFAIYDLLAALFAAPEPVRGSLHTEKLFSRVCDIVREQFADPEIDSRKIAR